MNRWKRSHVAFVIVAAGGLAFSGMLTTRAADKAAKADPALEHARKEVKMLDDVYKTAVVLITENYVTEDSDLPAGSAAKALFAAIEKKGWHTVVLTSTVLPGAMRHGLVPVLEQHSGKLAGSDFGVCYSPEFIALGSVIRDFLNPDFLLIGELDPRSGDHLAACYADIMGPATPGTPVRFRVLVDGQPPGAARGVDVDEQGAGTVSEQRMYTLIRQPGPITDRQFEIQFLGPGVEAFAFTFG